MADWKEITAEDDIPPPPELIDLEGLAADAEMWAAIREATSSHRATPLREGGVTVAYITPKEGYTP